MIDTRENKNQVYLTGVLAEDFKFSHEVNGRKFYKSKIKCERLSGESDVIPIMVLRKMVRDIDRKSYLGYYVEVEGEYRSFNEFDGEKTHLILDVMVSMIHLIQNEENVRFELNKNEIYLEGYVCRKPVFRTTPLGRQITDIQFAVNRRYSIVERKRADYIPCIFWGQQARYMASQELGTKFGITGRIQQRFYLKKVEGQEEPERKCTYEVSVFRLELLV